MVSLHSPLNTVGEYSFAPLLVLLRGLGIRQQVPVDSTNQDVDKDRAHEVLGVNIRERVLMIHDSILKLIGTSTAA